MDEVDDLAATATRHSKFVPVRIFGSERLCLTMALLTIGTGTIESARYILFPVLICGVGVVAAVLSVILFRLKNWNNPHKALNIATYIAAGIVLLATVFLAIFYVGDWKLIISVLAGLLSGIGVGFIAEIYTSADYKEVKRIAEESQTGHATNIIAGLGSGMKSTALTIAVLVVAIAVAYFFSGSYGIALAAVGMLSTAGITVTM